MESTENKHTTRVIITYGTSIISLMVAQSLGNHGIDIVGAGCVKHTPLFFSKYVNASEVYTSADIDEEQFLSDLEKIIKKHQPEEGVHYVLMPTFKETVLISKHKERFSPYITVAAPDYASIEKIFPKQNLAQTLLATDVSAPLSFVPKDKRETYEAIEKIGYPFLVKPYNESGGRGIQKVKTQQEFEPVYAQFMAEYGKPPIIQELVKGDDYCYAAIFDKGKLKAGMAYKTIGRFPIEAGSSVMRKTVDDAPFAAIAEQLMLPLGWTGVAQIDFMWSGNKEEPPRLIEVNPRFWAGLYQSILTGVDFPWLLLLLFTGQALPEDLPYHMDVKTRLPGTWVLSSFQESFNLQSGFGKVQELGSKALEDLKDKSALEVIKTFSKAVAKGLNPEESFQKLISSLENGSKASDEVDLKNDPYVLLGSLYIVEYFFKYKKLPPELKF